MQKKQQHLKLPGFPKKNFKKIKYAEYSQQEEPELHISKTLNASMSGEGGIFFFFFFTFLNPKLNIMVWEQKMQKWGRTVD